MKLKGYYNYFKTVMKHKIAVFKVCRMFGITWRGIVHDLSKFSPSEFIPYAKYFNIDKSKLSKEEKNKLENDFEVAWLHHKGCNKHHHLFWINWSDDDNVPYAINIPLKYVYEMIADWIGAGMTYNSNWNESEPYEYYKNNLRESKCFDYFEYRTKAIIDTILVDIKNHGLDTVGDMIQCGFYENFYCAEVSEWNNDYCKLVNEYYGGNSVEEEK